MFRSDRDLRDQLDGAIEVAGLGLVLLLICFFTYVLLSVQIWVLLGVSLVGAVALIDGVRLYIKGKRGLRKCVQK